MILNILEKDADLFRLNKCQQCGSDLGFLSQIRKFCLGLENPN